MVSWYSTLVVDAIQGAVENLSDAKIMGRVMLTVYLSMLDVTHMKCN
jgi:hypothetical protein